MHGSRAAARSDSSAALPHRNITPGDVPQMGDADRGQRDEPLHAVPHATPIKTNQGNASFAVRLNASGEETQIVIDIVLLDDKSGAWMTMWGERLARHRGLLLVDGRWDVSLPESEGFKGIEWGSDGSVTLRQGWDPALSYIDKRRGRVTIPVTAWEPLNALREGASVVINPHHCQGCASMFRGVVFEEGTFVAVPD